MNDTIYHVANSEQAFRRWQETYNGCLTTNWTVSTEKANGCSFDRFCLLRYTGRLTFNLRPTIKIG